MSRTQKNKATEGHLGLLKARLAKASGGRVANRASVRELARLCDSRVPSRRPQLRTMLQEGSQSKKTEGEGFSVQRYGHGCVGRSSPGPQS